MSGRQMGWVVFSILLLCVGWLVSITPSRATATRDELATTTVAPTTSLPTTSVPPSTTVPPPTSSITTTIPTTTVTSTTTTAPVGAVSPILECVEEQVNGTFTAHFGYSNGSDRSVTIPTGPDNGFTPPPLDRGQPSSFFPGRQIHVFAVSFDGSNLVWTVRSPNGSVWNAAASRESIRCGQNAIWRGPGSHSDLIEAGVESLLPDLRPATLRPSPTAKVVVLRRVGGLQHRYERRRAK